MSIELQNDLQSLVAQDFELENLEKYLSPVPFYVNNKIFVSHIAEIVKIIVQDRDKDQKFTVNDLLLFSKDILAMTTFITAVLLILNSIPNVKITYTEGETEEFIFKLIVYIFLVIVPKETGLKLTHEEKKALLNVSVLAYMALINSQLLKKLITKVLDWFKHQWQNCFISESVIDKKMPKLHQQLNNVVKQ